MSEESEDAETGRFLRDRRKLAKVTQRDLAELSGLSVHTLSDLESGKGNPTLDVLARACAALGLEIRLAPCRTEGFAPPSQPRSVVGVFEGSEA
jgi:transcriptional regulator with XRE-family HTH domain